MPISKLDLIKNDINSSCKLLKKEVVDELYRAEYSEIKPPSLDSVVNFATDVMFKYHDRDHGPKVDLHDDELDLFAKIILVIIDDWGVYDDVLSEQNTCNKLEILKRLLIKKADAFRNNSLYGDTL